ncbi:MAG TPA: ABC transporter permease [Jatrophihabitans sp.]|jgi:D-xylose transport system permease protein
MTSQVDNPGAGQGTSSAPEHNRPSSFSLDAEHRTFAVSLRNYWGRLRSGDPGALPSVLGLVVLAVIFSQVSGRFISKFNIGNLPGQGAYIAIIALGLVFVLLLGEIDLSAGTTGGMAAGFAAQGIFSHGLHHGVPGSNLLFGILVGVLAAAMLLGAWLKAWTGAAVVGVGIIIIATGLDQHVIPALIAAISIGAAVGIFIGWLVGKIGVPSFVVTLALFLAWQGVLLFALNANPLPNQNYKFWFGLTHNNLSPTWTWIFMIVVVGSYFLYTLFKAILAKRHGINGDTIQLVVVRGGTIAVVGVIVTIFANENRGLVKNFAIHGLPWAAVIPICLMIVCTIALNKTSWGRHLFATGGNAEAARRAGIDVVHIKVTAFTICSSFGALGGIFLASNNGSVALDLGAGNILLFSVAAAVIGGTSLFGGRGKPRDAIIGALVITIIPNGLLLRPSLPAAYQNVLTGLVLLLAASVDAMSRRRARTR